MKIRNILCFSPAAGADRLLGAFTEKLLTLEENNVRDKITIDAGMF